MLTASWPSHLDGAPNIDNSALRQSFVALTEAWDAVDGYRFRASAFVAHCSGTQKEMEDKISEYRDSQLVIPLALIRIRKDLNLAIAIMSGAIEAVDALISQEH